MQFAGKMILSAAVAMALTACATGPRTLETGASATSLSPKVTNVYVESVIDRRGKDAQISDIYGRAMEGADIMGWLSESLEARGLAVGGEADESQVCSLDLELRKAEIGGVATSKTASVVIGARNTQTQDYKILRGQDATVNWIGGNSETNAALGRALDKALGKIETAC